MKKPAQDFINVCHCVNNDEMSPEEFDHLLSAFETESGNEAFPMADVVEQWEDILETVEATFSEQTVLQSETVLCDFGEKVVELRAECLDLIERRQEATCVEICDNLPGNSAGLVDGGSRATSGSLAEEKCLESNTQATNAAAANYKGASLVLATRMEVDNSQMQTESTIPPKDNSNIGSTNEQAADGPDPTDSSSTAEGKLGKKGKTKMGDGNDEREEKRASEASAAGSYFGHPPKLERQDVCMPPQPKRAAISKSDDDYGSPPTLERMDTSEPHHKKTKTTRGEKSEPLQGTLSGNSIPRNDLAPNYAVGNNQKGLRNPERQTLERISGEE